jgi:hypothetical protein
MPLNLIKLKNLVDEKLIINSNEFIANSVGKLDEDFSVNFKDALNLNMLNEESSSTNLQLECGLKYLQDDQNNDFNQKDYFKLRSYLESRYCIVDSNNKILMNHYLSCLYLSKFERFQQNFNFFTNNEISEKNVFSNLRNIF